MSLCALGTPRVRAVLLDLDGTLYRQGPLRRRMLAELAGLPLRGRGREAWALGRRLAAFRRVREELRALGRPDEALEDVQYEAAARHLSEEPERVRAAVREWIHERPLRHLAGCARPGVRDCLASWRGAGLSLGVVSDYPAAAKLEALGLSRFFSLAIGSTDPEINAFKPHPRGLLVACGRLGVAPDEALYVGDRVDVDGAAARAAGMRFAGIGMYRRAGVDVPSFQSFRELLDAFGSGS
jgi:FMN phosphatase YigB (HAD superfamily)